MQQFLADSPWDSSLVVRAVAERVAPEIGVEAWVLDDTGFPKDGKHSPGVKRQYSGTLGKIGNCQLGVSLHAVGKTGTVPLGWALYLPDEWCEDPDRRRKAKIPHEVAVSKPSRARRRAGRARAAAGRFAGRRCSVTRLTARRSRPPRPARITLAWEYVLSIGPEPLPSSPAPVRDTAPSVAATRKSPRPDREPGRSRL